MRALLVLLVCCQCGGAVDEVTLDAGCSWRCPDDAPTCAVAERVCGGDQ